MRELDGGRGEYELCVPGSDSGGFDVGAEIRTYGIYPLLGGCQLGWSWDVVSDLSIEQICTQFLSLVRATLSEDCRLRRTLLAGEVYDFVIEAASPHGWQIVDSLPLGLIRRWRLRKRQYATEQMLQNRLLPPVGFAEGRDTWDNFVFRRHVG
ncbi:MAG: hypothetical protein DMF84_30000 [Acidobacteria bacterium]|nr:MAG: hypothetical protein DMF84_30000 [Acidobacteriota bacterium]